MKRAEKVQNQVLFLLASEGDLTSNQLASPSNPVTSIGEMTMAVDELRKDGEIEKINGKWSLVDDEADNADAA
ncbi:MAG: hypothetical protein COA83_09800 [Methylophaga sp.]|nr:MAG: hypothetical protein COA83_09800 [Methylophaga sp.]